MKNSCIHFLILLLVSCFAFSVQAQSGSATRQKNLLGYYKYSVEGQKLSEKEFLQYITPNQQAYNEMRMARKSFLIASVHGAMAGVLLGSQLNFPNDGSKVQPELVTLGVLMLAISIPYNITYKKQSERALELYNAGLAESNSSGSKMEYRFGFNGSGLGMQLKF